MGIWSRPGCHTRKITDRCNGKEAKTLERKTDMMIHPTIHTIGVVNEHVTQMHRQLCGEDSAILCCLTHFY